jgi:hypothetical protein
MVVLAGCGAGTSPPSESGRASHPQEASPIPQVSKPLDVTALARRPCELLSSKQATGFMLGVPPKQYDAALGDVGCEWTTTTQDRRTVRTVQIDTFTNNPTLEVAYAKRQDLPFFKLIQINSYPAIMSRPVANLGHCDIDVKIAERQSVSVAYESQEFDSNPQRSCEIGKQVAAAVLMNLPPKR